MEVMNYLMCLCICFNLAAFQPPEQRVAPFSQLAPVDMSTEQLRELTAAPVSGQAPSYLSLLPSDIRNQLMSLLAYSSVAETIAHIRESDYFKQLQKRISEIRSYPLYSNEIERREVIEINREVTQLIETLFNLYQSKGADKFTIALMLNLRPSFEIAFRLPPPSDRANWLALDNREQQNLLIGQYHDTHRIFSILQQYITENTLNYQTIIEYVKSFFANYSLLSGNYQREMTPTTISDLFGAEYERNYDEDKIFVTILDMFEDELKQNKQMPELKVLLNARAHNLVKELLCKSPKALLNNPLVQRYLRKRNLSNTIAHVTDFQQKFTQSWIDIFLEYLNANRIEASWMFERMYDCQNTLLKRLLIEKAGIKLITYQFQSPNGYFSLNLYQPSYHEEFYIELLEYLFKHDAAATKILIGDGRIKKFIEEKLKGDPSFVKGYEDRKTAIAFLIALIESPSTETVNFIKELLDARMPIAKSEQDIVANFADQHGITLLMHAIKVARFDIANLLLDQPNININVCDRNGHNALSFAGLLPESPERDMLIKRLKEMGAEEEGVCAIQ